ncbi:MAG TPA: hypothetical protein VL382_11520, partial [Terriglobales bacterium]|nr:hypothetical protein [Terriglobales bacterium]
VGCVAGASLLSDYLTMALTAGLTELSIPQVTEGRRLTDALAPSESSSLAQVAKRCGCQTYDAALGAIVSAKIHGRKPL